MDYEKELEEQNNAINNHQRKMQMESNYYYEPTIKTTRNKNYYQVDYVNEVTRLNAEKQQLIKFLENKIKECDRYLKTFEGKEQGDYSVHYYYAERDKKDFQEVLDFIKKGSKDE